MILSLALGDDGRSIDGIGDFSLGRRQMRCQLSVLRVSILGRFDRMLQNRCHLTVELAHLVEGQAIDTVSVVLLQLILEMLQHLLRTQDDLLVEVSVIVHLQKEHRSLSNIFISVFAVEPLLDAFCELYVIHKCEN